MGNLSFLTKKKERANQEPKSSAKPRIDFSNYLYPRGEVVAVKLFKNPSDDATSKDNYVTEFYHNKDGEKINIEYKNGNKAYKIAYVSPSTNGEKDEAELYKAEIYKELNQKYSVDEIKEKAKELIKFKTRKEQSFYLGHIITHTEEGNIGTNKIIHFNSDMNNFIYNSMNPDKITDTIKENASVSLKTGRSRLDSMYNVVSVAEGVVVVDDTINVDDISDNTELIIDNVTYTFDTTSGNTFIGVDAKRFTEDDIFGDDSEYYLHMACEVIDNGGLVYKNYSLKSSFKHISELKKFTSANGGYKFSDVVDVEKQKKELGFDLNDAGGKLNTYEESYFKFHKYYLKEDIEFKDVKDILAKRDKEDVPTPTNEDVKETPKEETPNPTPKAKLSIDESDKKTDFEKKMDAVESSKPEEVVEKTVLTTETKETETKSFDISDLEIDLDGIC